MGGHGHKPASLRPRRASRRTTARHRSRRAVGGMSRCSLLALVVAGVEAECDDLPFPESVH